MLLSEAIAADSFAGVRSESEERLSLRFEGEGVRSGKQDPGFARTCSSAA